MEGELVLGEGPFQVIEELPSEDRAEDLDRHEKVFLVRGDPVGAVG